MRGLSICKICYTCIQMGVTRERYIFDRFSLAYALCVYSFCRRARFFFFFEGNNYISGSVYSNFPITRPTLLCTPKAPYLVQTDPTKERRCLKRHLSLNEQSCQQCPQSPASSLQLANLIQLHCYKMTQPKHYVIICAPASFITVFASESL